MRLTIAPDTVRILDFSATTFVVRVHTPSASDVKKDDPAVVLPSEPDSTASDQNGHSAASAKRKHPSDVEGQEFGTRRSKRTKSIKKPYKEIKIPVSKWDTVMDLKLKVGLQLKGKCSRCRVALPLQLDLITNLSLSMVDNAKDRRCATVPETRA